MKSLWRIILCALLCGACAPRGLSAPEVQSSSARAAAGSLKTVTISVARKDLWAALQRGSPSNDLRMVPVFSGAPSAGDGDEPPPQYRFFDVKTDSAYYLLGMRNSDVLVTAHDHVVYEPEKFPAYIRMLLGAPEGWVEIRRGAELLLLSFKIHD